MDIQKFISSNPDQFRKNIVVKLQILLEMNNEEDYEIHATNIEKSVFNYAIKEANTKKIIKKWDNRQFLQLYIDKLRSVYINLKNTNNTDLLEKIKHNEIPSQQVAFMTHQEMNQEQWRTLIDQKIKRDASKYNTNIEASTDMYTCRKCKSKKCTYYELQTRSADEPATIFVTCLNCGKNWRG
jgi:transcription elongation factor S-II